MGTRASGKIDFTVRRTSRSVFKPPPRSPLYLAFHCRCYCAYLSPSACASVRFEPLRQIICPSLRRLSSLRVRLFRHLCSARRRSCVRSGVHGATAFLSSLPRASAGGGVGRSLPPPRRFGQGENNRSCSRQRPRGVDSPSPSFAAESQKTSCTTNHQGARRHYGRG